MTRTWRARAAASGSCQRSATSSSCNCAFSHTVMASSHQRSTGPANSQSMNAVGVPAVATTFHGPVSQ
jgi:hypothetical protein